MGKKEGGLGWGGGTMELGERKEEGGNMCLIQRRKKKVNSVPLFFVEHLALTLPCFLYSLPPPQPPQLIHTDTQGPADLQDITPASLFPTFCTEMHAS